MESITLNWNKGMSLTTEIDGQQLIVASPDAMVKGIRPKPLLLAALAGCSALDVVSLAAKMRVEMSDFKVDSVAEVSSNIPAVYTYFALRYRFYGKELDRAKLVKMVTLSQDRYCGVSAMLAKAAPLTFVIELNDTKIYDSQNVELPMIPAF